MAPSYCEKERKECVKWVEIYFKDCLCSLRDEISFSFGLISLVSWGVAEIPQIITIFRNKSSHGLSLAFLLTWVAGDICNLVGCLLEPATLPTQFYTAMLYASTTVILLLQIVYYDHIRRWYNNRRRRRHKINNNKRGDEEEKRALNPKPSHESGIPIPTEPPKAQHYYMSARSLAGSATPPSITYMRAAKSGPSAMEFIQDSSSDDEASPPTSQTSAPRPIPRSFDGRYGTFLAAAINLPLKGTNAIRDRYIGFSRSNQLLQENEIASSTYGQSLGWIMAAIYTCSRIPQIWLNIKRGSVDGLNPFMFIFALIANATYLGSILVRSTEWESIRANLPWLLDATVCVALDFFIISQYIYYRYLRRREASDDGEYEQVGKLALS